MAQHGAGEPGLHGAFDEGSDEAKIGKPLKRKEIPRFLQGIGTFADDYHLPDQAYAAYVRSFHPHAKILGLRT